MPELDLYTNMSWLQVAPIDFRRRCRAITIHDQSSADKVRSLASFALNESQLYQLGHTITSLLNDGVEFSGFSRFKLGIVSNSTVKSLAPALVASAARYGIALEVVVGEYSQTLNEALSATSTINASRPDAVLIALDHHGLPIREGNYGLADSSELVTKAHEFVSVMRDGFRAHAGAFSILQTVPQLPQSLFGNLEAGISGSSRSLIHLFNTRLVESVQVTQDILFDVAALAETVGLATWHSAKQWNMAKFAFDSRFIPLYTDHVGRILGALFGKSRKCLVLDLDNTIWGGVIGDDGVDGIVIGQGNATGEAFLEVQRVALALRDRGIVLAVSSKNSDDIARRPFTDHPDMLLKLDHIAVFQANWSDKATNISSIAKELNLGIDSMVFLDDNPVERQLVREMLPQVAVPELPDDPALYARTLLAAGYFETVAFSNEDRKRAEFYTNNARRVALQSSVGDLAGYLKSLNMTISFRPFDATGRSRIAQLINKSNQFNLTTRRYTEADVAEFEADSAIFTLQVRLSDAFGDNGMISVIICKPISAIEWCIDTWLMSCRVLGRRVEQMVLREIIYHARLRKVETLTGMYVPTDRNEMVSEHYQRLGFTLVKRDDSGITTWQMSTAVDVEIEPMIVDRSGFELTAV